MLIYFISYKKQEGLQPIRLVLIGVGSAMALSGLMILMISSADRVKVDFITKWLSGGVWGADWPYLLAFLPWFLILIPYILYKSNTLNIMALSPAVGVGLGLSMEKEQRGLLLAAVSLAAAAVAITGGISFIGLLAPHISRSLVGPRHQRYLPLTLLLGGWLLLFADSLGRFFAAPEGIPAGIMCAIIGAPYFLYLLIIK